MGLGRIAIIALLVHSLMSVSCAPLRPAIEEDTNRVSGGKQAQLTIQAEAPGSSPSGSIVGCMRPALDAAGVDWSSEYLRGFLGHAFTFSMNGEVHQAINWEWSYFHEMLDYLNFETISAQLHGDNGVSREEHDRVKMKAWIEVRQAIDEGYPAIAWQVMTLEMKKSRPKPALWSLIVGYDEVAETYLVSHDNFGEFTIRWDGFGHTDPANLVLVWIFRPSTESPDPAAHRRAIKRAIDSSKGMYPGHTQAPAHGLAAWELWLMSFAKGTVSIPHVSHHAAFLIDARGAAAIYLREIESLFPDGANAFLCEAANRYGQVVYRMEELRSLFSRPEPDLKLGTEILTKALESERAALAALQQALESE